MWKQLRSAIVAAPIVHVIDVLTISPPHPPPSQRQIQRGMAASAAASSSCPSSSLACRGRLPAAMLAISPGNSFFSTTSDHLARAVDEGLEIAEHVVVFCPAESATHTYAAIGAKTKNPYKQRRAFYRSIQAAPAFDPARVHFLDWTGDFVSHPDFAGEMAHFSQMTERRDSPFAMATRKMTEKAVLSLAKAHHLLPADARMDALHTHPDLQIDLDRAGRYMVEEFACIALMPRVVAALLTRLGAVAAAETLAAGRVELPFLYCREWPLFASLCSGELDGIRRPMAIRVLRFAQQGSGATPPSSPPPPMQHPDASSSTSTRASVSCCA